MLIKMEKGYFNISLTSEEIALARYICNYVKSKEPSDINVVRLAKIIVHVTLKQKLPVRLFWYDMGLCGVVQPQVPVNYDYDYEKKVIEDIFDFKGIGKLNEAIDEGMEKYSSDLSVLQVRKKQYEELNDSLYLTKLKIEDFISKTFLFDKKDKFLSLISKFILDLPEDVNYKELNEIVKEFAVISNSLLNFCENNKTISNNIINSLESILEYLNALNARYKKLKGFEELFTPDTNPQDIDQRLWVARNSLIVLKKDLSEYASKESISLNSNLTKDCEAYSDMLNLLIN